MDCRGAPCSKSALIGKNTARDSPVAELAQTVGLSEYHFSKLFNDDRGWFVFKLTPRNRG